MELRTLRYFLAVCREGNMSRAAERLHVTQPTLSRQVAELERELGCDLLVRHSRSVEPTEDGLFLLRRANEIIGLVDQTEADLKFSDEVVEGDVNIGAGESEAMREVAARMQSFQERYPHVRFHVHSGDASFVIDRLERGLDDFALLLGYPNIDRYAYVRLSRSDVWGVYMLERDPLASSKSVEARDLVGLPLLVPDQALELDTLSTWFGAVPDSVDVRATFNLGHNGALMVREGVGYMVGLGDVQHVGEGTGLVFRPLNPAVVATADLAWLRDKPMSRAASLFAQEMSTT